VKQIFVSIVLSSLWLASIAQHQIGVRMNIGISTISEETSSTKEVQVAPNISGFIGAAYLYNAESTVGFEADLIVTQIRASEIITEDGSFQGCIYCTGLTSITKDYSFTYVAFPVYLKSNTKRFNFGFGLQTGVPFCIPGVQFGINFIRRTASASNNSETPFNTTTSLMEPSALTTN
jgi:hypothetical protein